MTKRPAKRAAKTSRRRPRPSPNAGPGRPPVYDPAHHPQLAYKLALLGAGDAIIAEGLGVNEVTLHRWKAKHPEFCKSLEAGKLPADADGIASLHKRVTGFTRRKTETITDPANPEKSIVKVTEEEVPPDLGAIKLWNHNRLRPRGLWKGDPEEGAAGALGQGIGAILASIDGQTRGFGAETPPARDEDGED